MDPNLYGTQANLFANNEASWLPQQTQFRNPSMVAPQAAPQMIAPPAAKQAWYKTRWIWILIVLLIILMAVGYWAKNRYYGDGAKLCPYSAAISTVSNTEHQADLREWAALWKQAQRPAVKRILSEVLNSELGAPATANPATANTNATNNATPDPAFTVA